MASASKRTTSFSVRNILVMFIRALVGAYALSTLLHLALNLLIGEKWIVVEFFNTFAQLLWLPTLILIPMMLLFREWRLASMMIPAMCVLLFIWGDMYLPNETVAPQAHDVQIRVLTYNIYAGNSEPDAYVQAIRETDADIVALQELNYSHTEILAAEYPYLAFHPGGTHGQGLISRYPILEDTYWQFDYLLHALGHQRTELAINDTTTIVLYNVHPSHPGMQNNAFNPEFRSREIADIISLTAQETLPTLLVGDFNMPDFSEDYRNITGDFQDTFHEAGYGFGWTFPTLNGHDYSVLRLDYIFADNAFRSVNSIVWDSSYGSDHRGLYTDLLFNMSQAAD